MFMCYLTLSVKPLDCYTIIRNVIKNTMSIYFNNFLNLSLIWPIGSLIDAHRIRYEKVEPSQQSSLMKMFS